MQELSCSVERLQQEPLSNRNRRLFMRSSWTSSKVHAKMGETAVGIDEQRWTTMEIKQTSAKTRWKTIKIDGKRWKSVGFRLRFSLENDRASFRRDVEAQVDRLDAFERELQTVGRSISS